MIVRMTKYSFVVLSQELDSFLLKLQELGMMDITRSVRPIDQNSKEMVEVSSRYKSAISLLGRLAKECEGITPIATEASDDQLLQTVEKVFAAKGRPADNPLIVHVCRKEDVDQIICDQPLPWET
jgi:hypothetical protein